MIFPEAVWNLSPNKLVLDIFLGTVKAALETNSVIIVSAIERYGKNYIINQKKLDLKQEKESYSDGSFENMDDKRKKELLLKCNYILRDSMATALWEIWSYHAEEYGVERRTDLLCGYWDTFVAGLMSEWKGYKMSDNEEQQYQNTKEAEQREAFAFMGCLIPKKENAFLFRE